MSSTHGKLFPRIRRLPEGVGSVLSRPHVTIPFTRSLSLRHTSYLSARRRSRQDYRCTSTILHPDNHFAIYTVVTYRRTSLILTHPLSHTLARFREGLHGANRDSHEFPELCSIKCRHRNKSVTRNSPHDNTRSFPTGNTEYTHNLNVQISPGERDPHARIRLTVYSASP